MLSTKKLDFYIENNYNLLFSGKHGVGKTSIILDTFKRHNLNFLYFSGATLDPWVDFVGVPKAVTDENGVTYLELIRPKPFAYDTVQAIFIDELNRSDKKVRNAIMELLQFKSINGKVFNNLRVVWAAVNPPPSEDDSLTYQTEEFDPAQEDRFQIKVELPYMPSLPYFKSKYGELGTTAIDWWKTLSDKQKDEISPRRLDLLLELNKKGGDIADAVPKTVPVRSLINQLDSGGYMDRYNSLLGAVQKNNADTASMDALADFLDSPNVLDTIGKKISDKSTFDILYNALPSEYIVKISKKNLIFRDMVYQKSMALKDIEKIKHAVESFAFVFSADQSRTIRTQLEKTITNKLSKDLNNEELSTQADKELHKIYEYAKFTASEPTYNNIKNIKALLTGGPHSTATAKNETLAEMIVLTLISRLNSLQDTTYNKQLKGFIMSNQKQTLVHSPIYEAKFKEKLPTLSDKLKKRVQEWYA